MTTKGHHIDTEIFSCSICLDLLKDPVTIPCGHSYCMSCVDSHWDEEEAKKSYSCPQCRQSFTQRPVLVKNTMLVILMEGIKRSGHPAAAVCPSAVVCPSAAHRDVFCDLCSGRKVRAVKSCLQCLVSYCKEHLQPHYDVAALKKHKLVEPTENLQENICSEHDEVMKMFCRTDQQCICYLCSVDQHKDHDTVTAAAERAEKQRELQTYQQNILHRLDHKHKEVDLLQQQVKNSSCSSNAALELSDRSLKELVDVLEKIMTEVKQQVISTQEAEENRAKELQDKVELEITELKKTLTGLNTLSQTEDHVDFLRKFASVSKVSETSDPVNSSQSPPPFQDMVTAAVSKLRSALQETSLMEPPAALHKPKINTPKTDTPAAGAQETAPKQQTSSKDLQAIILPKFNQQPTKSDSHLHEPAVNRPPQPNARPAVAQETGPPQKSTSEEFLALPHRNLKRKTPASTSLPVQPTGMFLSHPSRKSHFKTMRDLQKYGRNLTWDSWSLNDKMELSNENTCVKRTANSRKYLGHPARFTHLPQVVSKESFTGCRFWEVKSTFPEGFTVAVAYKDIRRDGCSDDCSFGKNAKSWALECSHVHSVFWHNGDKVEIPTGASAVGVFLDYKAGLLSFYRMGYSFQHIHTVRTTFTQPLVAGLRLDDECSIAELSRRKFY